MKASSFAMTPPYEPTLVVVDADLPEMRVDGKPLPLPKFVRIRAPVAVPAALADVAKALVNAQKTPLIITDRAARTAAGMDGIVQLADLYRSLVIDYGNRNNFPTNQHLNTSWDRRLVAQADVILGLAGCDPSGLRDSAIGNKYSEAVLTTLLGFGGKISDRDDTPFKCGLCRRDYGA